MCVFNIKPRRKEHLSGVSDKDSLCEIQKMAKGLNVQRNYTIYNAKIKSAQQPAYMYNLFCICKKHVLSVRGSIMNVNNESLLFV